MDNTKEYILCAAWKRKKPIVTKYTGDEDVYKIELGLRHGDIYEKFRDQLSLDHNHQGFFTSRGRFVTRLEAAQIAFEACQIDEDTAKFNNKETVDALNKIQYVGQKPRYITIGDWRPLASEDLY